MDSQDYSEIVVRVSSEEQAEIVEAFVSDLGFDSFQFEEGEHPVLRCYVQTSAFEEQAFRDALSSVPDFVLEFEVRRMEAADWNAEWEKTGFTTIEVGNVKVCPSSSGNIPSEMQNLSDGVTIWLDPRMAFGTGHHDTTYMMLDSMQELEEAIRGKSVMDLGCGTAVLAILAAKLGASEVRAIDIDATAVRSALGNVRLNGLDFDVVCSDATALEDDSYDILLANIHRNIIIADMPRYSSAVRSGGRLLLSGFYESDIPDVAAAAKACGFTPAFTRVRSSWACLCFIKG